jgi:hypothetical protein
MEKSKGLKLHHFYHIYADGNWKEPVSEHIQALTLSGLLDNLTTFAIGFVGTPENCYAVQQFLKDIPYKHIAQETIGWEQVTQIPMWEFSKNNDGLMLYAHSKGSSNPSDVNIRWRRSMIYWNVIRWRDAIEKLETHEAVGCHWIQPLLEGMPEHTVGNWMFAGTFFWVKCETMKEFPRPALTHRHEAEGFIGYGWHMRPFPVYDFTPYFPNSGPFADHWLTNPETIIEVNGKTYA